jgi:hypothetical protein
VPGSSGIKRTLSVVYDVLAATVSVTFVVAVPFALAHDALGSPLGPWAARGLLAAVAVASAVPFVAGDWSLSKLTDFALAAFLAGLGGTVVFAVTTGGVDTGSFVATAATAGVVGFAYVVGAAYVLSRQRRHDTARGADDEWL